MAPRERSKTIGYESEKFCVLIPGQSDKPMMAAMAFGGGGEQLDTKPAQ